ncbi:MAG TPA: LuxR C-terminal-related transcriptional regulator [Sporichthyaceae bacterium]|nr:LuxR C-terminal-related transcriptional regulator [Sporichthyaceae bacterium]
MDRADEITRRATTVLTELAGTDVAIDVLAVVQEISHFLEVEQVDGERAAALGALAADLQQRALDLYRRQSVERTQQLADFRTSLRGLQGSTSTTTLIERVCADARDSCRFERVLISRVDDGHCRPWLANGEARGERWFRTWADGDISLRELSLAHVVTERRADLISTARRDNHDMVRLSDSTSYVAAPITAAGRVVGLFHCDHGGGGRPCNESDLNLISAFASEFSFAYERAVLVERVRSQQQTLQERLAVVGEHVRSVVARRPEPLQAYAGLDLDDLTARELEVLGLLARGECNQTIAAHLAIDPRTVKAHVSHILAKVGATNRSQLIALAYGRSW